MKLASYKQGRDGQLMVVSKDLEDCAPAQGIAETMQEALDDWQKYGPMLKTLSRQLEEGEAMNMQPFDQDSCASPLPRAYQVADGSSFLHHVELVRKARGAEMPPEFLTDPLMYQGVSDVILGPRDSIPVSSEEFGIDFEAEVAVIVDDVPMGVTPEDAIDHIVLIMLMNDVSLRNLIPAELGKGFGFFHSKPPSSFSPVAVTPDELGAAWAGGKVNLPLISTYNGVQLGRPNAGIDMQFDLPTLIAHAAKTRPLGAGAIIGTGTISNKDPASGVSCFAEIRMIEKIEKGEVHTPFMKYEDIIRIEMNDADGNSIFGAIEQTVEPYSYASFEEQKKAVN